MPARDVLTDARPAAAPAAPARPPGRAARALALQRAIGNHAVGRLLQRETEAEALLELPTYKERLAGGAQAASAAEDVVGAQR
jgi:hypothetical protein